MKRAPTRLSSRLLLGLEAAFGAVVARYGFSTGLAGTQELAVLLLVALTFLGALAAGRTLAVGRGSGPVHRFHRWWPA